MNKTIEYVIFMDSVVFNKSYSTLEDAISVSKDILKNNTDNVKEIEIWEQYTEWQNEIPETTDVKLVLKMS